VPVGQGEVAATLPPAPSTDVELPASLAKATGIWSVENLELRALLVHAAGGAKVGGTDPIVGQLLSARRGWRESARPRRQTTRSRRSRPRRRSSSGARCRNRDWRS